MTPTLSIVTVVRNDRSGLAATAESLAMQQWSDVECIVIDGASTDGTGALLETIEPRPARTVSEPDRGIYDAMNKGAALATGEWLLFLNAGDTLCTPATLADVAPHLANQPRDWGFGAVRNIAADGTPTGFQCASPFNASGLALGNTTVPHQATFMRRTLHEQLGGFRIDFGTEADQELIYRASRRGAPFEIVWPITDFRVGGAGMQREVGHFPKAMRRARMAEQHPIGGNAVIDGAATAAMLAKSYARAVEDRIARRMR
jgi:glycosyltransferase involved in cell wall biosynthesis